MSKHTLIKGTIILTAAGFLTRILGFFYRIWLSGQMGAELIGIYQLVFPVYSVCFTIYASGIQTAISKLTAEAERFLPKGILRTRPEAEREAARLVFSRGLLLSLSLALLLSLLLYEASPLIAARFLFEPRAEQSLRVLSFIFPFCSITACINGYYYGTKKSTTPALTQMLEQIVRIASVYFLAGTLGNGKIACETAVLGLIFGEAASAVFNLCSFALERRRDMHALRTSHTLTQSSEQAVDTHTSLSAALSKKRSPLLREISALAFPLSFNRLVVSLLHSFEATLVPFMLRKYGMTNAEALSHYGIINGMSMPFIFFPTAITGALSVLLLPAVSQASIRGETKKLNSTVFLAQKFSILLGMLSTALFILFGYDLGVTVFGEPLAGSYLRILAWLCPFLYVSSTFNSILNGLGKPYQTFLNSVIAMCIKISVIFFGVPHLGMQAYFLAILLSQIAITLMDGVLLYRLVGPACLPDHYLLKGGFALTFLGVIVAPLYQYGKADLSSPYLALLLYGGAYGLCALIACLVSGTVTLSELKELKR
ncbi:MAG: oligosaccharide flippase family protein [Lachnospiraceae bacterium]